MADANGEMVQQQLRGPARYLGFVLILLGGLPIFAKWFGYSFLPSVEWVARSNLPGIASGLIFGAGFLWLTCKSKYRIRGSEFRKVMAIFASPLMGYVVGNHIVVFAGPMIFALIAGHQVELSYAVADAGRHGTSRCRSPVVLRDVPFMFNSLCGVSNDFRHGLEPGDRILVIGRGTGLGVYAEGLRRGD